MGATPNAQFMVLVSETTLARLDALRLAMDVPRAEVNRIGLERMLPVLESEARQGLMRVARLAEAAGNFSVAQYAATYAALNPRKNLPLAELEAPGSPAHRAIVKELRKQRAEQERVDARLAAAAEQAAHVA